MIPPRQLIDVIGPVPKSAVIAVYPHATLFLATPADLHRLREAGHEPYAPSEAALALPAAAGTWDALTAAAPPEGPDPDRIDLYLLRYPGPLTPDWIGDLSARNALLRGSPAPGVVVVSARGRDLNELVAGGLPVSRVWYAPPLRVHPGVRRPVEGAPIVGVDLVTGTTAEAKTLVVELEQTKQSDGVVRLAFAVEGRAVVRTSWHPGVVNEANDPRVLAVLPFTEGAALMDAARTILGYPVQRPLPPNAPLDGAGEVIAIADFGFTPPGPSDDDLGPIIAGNVVEFSPSAAAMTLLGIAEPDGPADDVAGHGTHMISLASARGRTTDGNAQIMGAAPGASVHFQAIGISDSIIAGVPDDLGVLLGDARGAGARIHSNSWGNLPTSEVDTYTAWCADVDRFCFENRDAIVIFGAGNSGLASRLTTVYAPGTAKNALTVGACESNRADAGGISGFEAVWSDVLPTWALGTSATDQVSDDPAMPAIFSSGGAVGAGRIKPDVIAPGTNIIGRIPVPPGGAKSDATAFRMASGTSQAAAITAGVVACLRQWLIEWWGPSLPKDEPSSALVKALLISGVATRNANPGSQTGWGRVSLSEATGTGPSTRPDWIATPAVRLSTGETLEFQLVRQDPTRPVEATLVWTDAPGTLGSGEIVNSLQVALVEAASPTNQATGKAKHHAQRVLRSGGSDDWLVRVTAIAVTTHRASLGAPTGTAPQQDFALVVKNARVKVGSPLSEQWASRTLTGW